MRKYIFAFITLLILINYSFAQWVQQYPETPYIHLYDVKFVNQYTGWTCGGSGTILKTTNGGLNWLSQNSGIIGKYLVSISAVNSNVIYMVGFFETIIKTTNGGNNWLAIKNGPSGNGHSYEGVYFINENTGWICGSGSLIFKTTNGGVSFDSVNIPVGYLFDIYFRNANEGLVCGEAATMYKTMNGGLSWQEIIVPVGTEAADFDNLSVVNNFVVYTQGAQNNKIYKSTNFGISWDSISRVQGADDSYALCFPNEMTGWCAGSYGLMFKTTNGGYNWQPEVIPALNQAFFKAMCFFDKYTGWAVGGATKIFYTSNGGSTFINPISTEIPSKYSLSQNYPNPFNPTTNIKFSIVNSGEVKLVVYDIQGREVRTLVNESLKPGTFEAAFDGSALNSGVYFYKLVVRHGGSSTGSFTETKKMIYIK